MFLKELSRYFLLPYRGLSFLYGSRRLRKWMKKNDKVQDQNHHSFDKRWEYAVKKSDQFLAGMGIKLNIKNEENKPKGSFLLVGNHVSNFDAFYCISSLGKEIKSTAVAKSTLEDSTIRGYFTALESVYVYQNDIRKSLMNINRVGDWSKKNNRGVVIFPEGKRNWDGVMSEWSSASFKISQRNYLPIHPVSIIGSVEARRWWKFKTRKVDVIFHKPIKASETLKLNTIKITEKITALIQKDLDAYEEKFIGKEKQNRIEYKKKLRDKQLKFEKKYQKKLDDTKAKDNKKNKK